MLTDYDDRFADLNVLTAPYLLHDFGMIEKYRFEERIVKVLLKRYRIPDDYKWQMLKDAESRWGLKRLTLGMFLIQFPNFPMVLRASQIPRFRNDFRVWDLFTKFGNNPLVDDYDVAWRTINIGECGKPFGIVADVPGGGNGRTGLVLHNHRIDTRVHGSRLLWVSEHGQLALEPLEVLLDTIDSSVPGCKGWQPDLSEPVSAASVR